MFPGLITLHILNDRFSLVTDCRICSFPRTTLQTLLTAPSHLDLTAVTVLTHLNRRPQQFTQEIIRI